MLNYAARYGNELAKIQGYLEGPTPIRYLSGVTGLCMAAGIFLSLNHLKKDFDDIPGTVLKAYGMAAGLVVFLNEVKSGSSPRLDDMRQWVFKWFPMLSVSAGKGVFLTLCGTIGLYFRESYYVWVPGAALVFIGLVYIAAYFFDKDQMDEAIDKSMLVAAQKNYVPVGGPPAGGAFKDLEHNEPYYKRNDDIFMDAPAHL